MAGDGGILGFLKEKVPDLAVAVGDTMTGGAVSRIADALGIDVDSEEELEEKLRGNPELVAKLKQQERQLAFKELNAKLEDRQSAREMAIQRKDPDVDRLAYIILGGFFVLLTTVIVVSLLPDVDVGAEMMGVLATLIGYASAKANQVVSFYFGSSTGSKTKENQIGEAIRKLDKK